MNLRESDSGVTLSFYDNSKDTIILDVLIKEGEDIREKARFYFENSKNSTLTVCITNKRTKGLETRRVLKLRADTCYVNRLIARNNPYIHATGKRSYDTMFTKKDFK
ncbi:hypothetical protein SAMN02745116_00354 [Pilibacter termitis]|uniref:Uncharacterized protein n=1 Tax=Pilibacter termitis TaxID=263852 RepID=A0A1T4KRT3_9ENTE|nr:hypothetical protein SAMN02745116_00354 [Pilibacter termitis]